jgi:hypothetical protein
VPSAGTSRYVRENGVEAAVQSYASSRKDGTIPEGVVNSVGCHLLWQKRSADTIRMIKNDEKSLAVDPQNKNPVLQLKKLNGRRK